MTHDQAVKIAIECIKLRIKQIWWKAMRYKREPEVWPEYKAAYKQYKDLMKTIATLERIHLQGKLF